MSYQWLRIRLKLIFGIVFLRVDFAVLHAFFVRLHCTFLFVIEFWNCFEVSWCACKSCLLLRDRTGCRHYLILVIVSRLFCISTEFVHAALVVRPIQ